MRKLVLAAAPGAKQDLKWGMPAFSYDRILVIFGAFKRHIGFFITTQVRKELADDLKGYKTGSSSVQFPLDKPLPRTLIRKIVKLRAAAAKGRDAKWRTKD
jgi:uncharacterized protein YdhG (YjbR/CyaY superfamily)